MRLFTSLARAVLPTALCVFLTGCAGLLTPEQSAPHVSARGSGKIAVGVVDSRPYVLSGRKNESFEGINHFLYGIPQNTKNREKGAFAVYLERRLSAAFKAAGYTVSDLTLPAGDSDAAVQNTARQQGGRTFIVRLNEWYFDIGGSINVSCDIYYDVDVSVLDDGGRLLTRRRFADKKAAEFSGTQNYFNALLKEYQKIFDQILADQKIASALGGRANLHSGNEIGATARLKRLDTLRDENMISKDDYERERQRILQGL